MTTKVLFLNNSLRGGGAEKVLVNLVNGLDSNKYDVTVMSLFGEGVNRQFLHPNVHFISRFKSAPKGFVHWSKLLSPNVLHRWIVKEKYDVEVSFLQGVATRIVAGAPCDVKTISWIHNFTAPLATFRSKKEMLHLFNRYDKVVGVSKEVERKIIAATDGTLDNVCVLYNTHDVSGIIEKSKETVPQIVSSETDNIKLVAVGTLYDAKGYLRLLQIVNKLKQEGFRFSLWFVGDGPQRDELEKYVTTNSLDKEITFFGFDKNPYKYISKADLFICSSYTEGFSGVVSEATILGVPTLTTRCAGMDEILGENNEYGIIVDNSDEALYEGLKMVMSDPNILKEYKTRVQERKDFFDPSTTIKAVEDLIDSL